MAGENEHIFSTEINSELKRLPGFGEIGGNRKNKKYIREYPELEEFFTCAKGYRYPNLGGVLRR